MKVVVLGVGAQGSIIAKRLDQEPSVKELICADYNFESANRLAKGLKKASAVKVDARNKDEVLKVSQGAALLVNGLPPDFNMTLMQAALTNKCDYQDMASGPVEDTDFISCVKRQLAMDVEFKKAGVTALINTGSAPGLVSVLARNSADKLNSVDFIGIYVYDAIWTKRFIPFWWSPETAFGDMAAEPVNFVNGKFEVVKPYNDPVMIDFKGLGPRRMVDHEHEEPVTFGLYSDKVFKGCKNVAFKYGGPALELSESFYKMGLLSQEPVEVGGAKIIPLDLIRRLTPAAPNDPDTIREALSEGMISEEGAAMVRVDGKIDGKKTRIETYINAPGLTESFEKYQITHETFLTGQSAFLFTKMFVNKKIPAKGVFPPEVFEKTEREYYLSEAEKIGITIDEYIETRLF